MAAGVTGENNADPAAAARMGLASMPWAAWRCHLRTRPWFPSQHPALWRTEPSPFMLSSSGRYHLLQEAIPGCCAQLPLRREHTRNFLPPIAFTLCVWYYPHKEVSGNVEGASIKGSSAFLHNTLWSGGSGLRSSDEGPPPLFLPCALFHVRCISIRCRLSPRMGIRLFLRLAWAKEPLCARSAGFPSQAADRKRGRSKLKPPGYQIVKQP